MKLYLSQIMIDLGLKYGFVVKTEEGKYFWKEGAEIVVSQYITEVADVDVKEVEKILNQMKYLSGGSDVH